jgi:hypothetical protein
MQAKSPYQMGLHRLFLLIGAGCQQHVVTGMVVQSTERIATALTQLKIPFEVYLPQLVRLAALKALERLSCLALLGRDQTVPV